MVFGDYFTLSLSLSFTLSKINLLNMKLRMWPDKKKTGKQNETRSGFVHQSGSSGLVGVSYISCMPRQTKPHFYQQYLWNLGTLGKVLVKLHCIHSKHIFIFFSFGVVPGRDIIGYQHQLSKFFTHIIMFNFLFLV